MRRGITRAGSSRGPQEAAEAGGIKITGAQHVKVEAEGWEGGRGWRGSREVGVKEGGKAERERGEGKKE